MANAMLGDFMDYSESQTTMTTDILARMLEAFLEDFPSSEEDEEIVSHERTELPDGLEILTARFDSGRVFTITIQEDF